MAKVVFKTFGVVLALMIAAGQLAAAQAVISGAVSDEAGKPVRGAIVTATSGARSVSRYSQNDGRYEITVPSGNYDVAVDAFGFELKKQSVDTAKSSKIDFKLTSKLDVTRLTPAELETFLPDNADTRLIRRSCRGCHNLQTVMKMRGMPAAGWLAFLPTMTRDRLPAPDLSRVPAKSAALGEALEKYFGPAAPYLGPSSVPPKPEQVKHADVSDAALSATITEYQIPTRGAMPNGVKIDRKGRAWWGEFDSSSEVGELDPATGQIHLYPLAPNSTPKDAIVGKDGSIWFALDVTNLDTKLAKINPDTGEITYYKSDDPAWHGTGPHTIDLDPRGNIWTSGHYPAFFDIEKGTFRVYDLPVPKSFPEGSAGTWADVPGEPKASPDQFFNSYNSLAVDSKGIVYLTKLYEGTLIRFDPATGQTKNYRVPGMIGPRGVVIDGEDNVWFCDGFGGTLDKLDQKTGTIKVYHPPSENSEPFEATLDKRTGDIYFGDEAANRVTRFDPKTEKFVDYTLPTPEAMPRYVDIDSKGRIWYVAGGVYAGKIGVIDPGTKDQAGNSR